MDVDYQRGKRQYAKVTLGLYSSPMLFGAINVLLEQAGRRTYSNLQSMVCNLHKRGLKPVCRDYYAWWDAKAVIAAIFQGTQTQGGRVLVCHGQDITPEEAASGEYVLLTDGARLTGMTKKRIATFMNKPPEACRVDAESHKRVNLPTLREWGGLSARQLFEKSVWR